ncbi:Creatininase family protein [Rhodovastum atsumiense]|uniref:Creatininase family protein n=1 Tax=Rhodovastum atsumiense TaxID=504468 RepID=A0A5M6IS14_9PROT|nr:creatininase family protein [Rhodovastum atsumiense]KAA5611090.1 creatininase family protein [Rhodovastum atsumiense]CAH2599151.1 Creatininase family protein [Rhodovastum atsumiense]
MQLALSTWQEVEEYLQTRSGIIVPIGSVEQHGPNGLIGTDHLTAEFVARGVGDAIGCMVAPTLAYGMSQHHLGFAGSATLRPATLMLVVRDVVQSLAVHGFRRFFFINGHGGNIASVTAAFDELYAMRSLGEADTPVRCRMKLWSDGPRTRALSRELYGDADGHHATCTEVSVAQFYQPQAIKQAQLAPHVAPPSGGFFEGADYRSRFPDGRIGSAPALSSPEHGERLFAAAVQDMTEAYQAFLAY